MACPYPSIIATHVGYRSCLDFAIPRATTRSISAGRPVRRPETAGGGSWRCPNNVATSVPFSNGAVAVRHSYTTHASEYSSVRPSTSSPWICSGAAYSTVPKKVPVLVSPLLDVAAFVRPKSAR